MINPRSILRRLLRPISMLGLIGLLLALPAVVLAHPLDVYVQSTYLTVAPAQIEVELDLSPGVLVAPQVLAVIDADGNQEISDAESQAYAATVLQNVELTLDDQPLTLAVSKIEMPTYITTQAGYGMIRIFTVATMPSALTGTHDIYFINNFKPVGTAYQVNGFVAKGAQITLGKQNRDEIQQSMKMAYTIGATVASATATPVVVAAVDPGTTGVAGSTGLESPAGASEQVRQLLGYMYEPSLSPWLLLVGLGLAVMLGGLHALTPGHGKTLVAAYLVGSRGTMKHAVALGIIVTFTHTASVVLIGLLALFASKYVVPNVLVPALQVCSGLLVVVLGARLIWSRLRQMRGGEPAHDHDHDHSHDGAHSHDHSHGGQSHSHALLAEGVKMGSLVAMGVSGGMVPCPEALGIMVIAVGLNKIALGLGLIVSFSVGLAAVLIVIGILLVRMRPLTERLGGMGGSWSRVLPMASAVIVTVLGAAITIGGLMTYIG